MGRVHYMQDRVKIMRRKPTIDKGIVQNHNRGIVENVLVDYPDYRDAVSEWIPARLRIPSGDEEVSQSGAKVDLSMMYELVMYAWDENGDEIYPKQHDELIIKYKRDGSLVDTTTRLRITGTIQEVRKRSKVYSFIMPVVMYTEF